jgi:hypothetical protein
MSEQHDSNRSAGNRLIRDYHNCLIDDSRGRVAYEGSVERLTSSAII